MNYANYDEYSDERTSIALSGKPFYVASIGLLAGAPIASGLYGYYGSNAYDKYGSKWATQGGIRGKVGGAWKSIEGASKRSRVNSIERSVKSNAKGLLTDYVSLGPGIIGRKFDRGRRVGMNIGTWTLKYRNNIINGKSIGDSTREIGYLNGVKGSSKYLAPGLGFMFGTMSIEQGLRDKGSLVGAYVGLGSEIGATVGARAGGVIGTAIGSFAGGVGAPVGGAIGMLAGGYIGYQLAPTVMNIARAVRRFGTPETGGMFRDNEMTQTMRQRSMLSIRTSQMNLRSELGRESQMLMNALY